jgi:HK97 family phage major capsid protein
MSTPVIPQTSTELQELVNDPKKAAPIFANKDTRDEFLMTYARKVFGFDPDLKAQLNEQVQIGLADMLKGNGLAKGGPPVTLTPGSPQFSAVRNAMYNRAAPGAPLDGTYSSLGDFALDVYRANKTGAKIGNPEAWQKVTELSNNYSETDPGSGGFLVPEEMRTSIMSLALERSVVRSRATVITMNSLTTRIPVVDETTHSGSLFGGMIFYWIGESASITPTNAKFGNVKLEANKLVGGARVPNELFADASALRTWLEANAPRGLAFYEDLAFIAGGGVGQPLGLLNAAALVQFDRSGDAAVTIDDLAGMYARMLPESLGSAVWLVNQTVVPKIFALSTGTGGYPLGVTNIQDNPVTTIFGRPMVVTEKLPANNNGAGNDIVFADLSYYLVGDRQAISLDYSEHSRFMNDETELRLIERVDGRPWIQSALTPVHGDSLSPFVGVTES